MASGMCFPSWGKTNWFLKMFRQSFHDRNLFMDPMRQFGAAEHFSSNQLSRILHGKKAVSSNKTTLYSWNSAMNGTISHKMVLFSEYFEVLIKSQFKTKLLNSCIYLSTCILEFLADNAGTQVHAAIDEKQVLDLTSSTVRYRRLQSHPLTQDRSMRALVHNESGWKQGVEWNCNCWIEIFCSNLNV